jgi:hypothetical protein
MEPDVQPEVIALLFPENAPAAVGAVPLVTALLRDAEGFMQLRHLEPDPTLLRRARVAGRINGGKPIVDPLTREVIGCEIEPITDVGR